MLFHPNLSESGKTAAVEIHLYSQGTGQARRAGARRWSPRVWSGALQELVGWQGPLGLSRWLALSRVQSSSRSGELSLLRLALWVAALCYSSPDFQRQVHLGR